MVDDPGEVLTEHRKWHKVGLFLWEYNDDYGISVATFH